MITSSQRMLKNKLMRASLLPSAMRVLLLRINRPWLLARAVDCQCVPDASVATAALFVNMRFRSISPSMNSTVLCFMHDGHNGHCNFQAECLKTGVIPSTTATTSYLVPVLRRRMVWCKEELCSFMTPENVDAFIRAHLDWMLSHRATIQWDFQELWSGSGRMSATAYR